MTTDPFDQWADEESTLGEIVDLGDGLQAEVTEITDSNREAFVNYVILSFAGGLCPCCQQPMTEDDLKTAKVGLYADFRGLAIPIHAHCHETIEIPRWNAIQAACDARWGAGVVHLSGAKTFDKDSGLCTGAVFCLTWLTDGYTINLTNDVDSSLFIISGLTRP